MRNQAAQPEPRTRKQRGFSLIELLIVVAVILVIAAIAIPNFLRSRMRANETAAVQNLRNITTANTVYLTTYGIGFSDNLIKLGGNAVITDSTAAGLIDSVLSSGVKTGYSFTYVVTGTDPSGQVVGYSVNAEPTNVGATGDRFFFVDQSCIIRHNGTGPAGSTDPAI
jgi:prepilin-type N-terminal cleavage/methylation domain-containing protein